MLESTRRRLGSYTLALALGLSALGGGAVHLTILAAFTLLVIATGLLMGESAEEGAAPGSPREWVALSIWFLLAAFCLFQALPLPLRWVQALAADNADIWSRALQLPDVPTQTFASLSLAPGRTVLEALKAANYGMVFAASVQLGRQGEMTRVAAIGFGTALAVSLATAGHQLTGAQELYGFYRPIDAYSIAPLMNANSRAGYLNLGFFCGLGLLFRSGASPRASLIGLGLALVAAEVLLCESVGGTGCLAIGLVLVLLLRRGDARATGGAEFARWLQAGIVIVIGVGAALMALAARRSALGLDQLTLAKFEIFGRAWQLAREHFGFGVGRGAFGSVFAAYQGTKPQVLAEHVENFPIQWAAEWGIPVTLAALLALGWGLWPVLSKRTWISPTRRCALVGCFVLVLQNQVDLGLEIPAIAALLCAVLGGLYGASVKPAPESPSTHDEMARTGAHRRKLFRAASLLTALCLGLALALGVDAPSRLRRQLHAELVAAKGAPPAEFWAALHSALRAYPAEPYFPLLASSAALSAGQNALPWISRALERSPANAQTYLQLARILRAGGATSQALGALRHTLEVDPRLDWAVLPLAATWGLSTEELAAIAPSGAAGAPLLLQLASRTEDIPLRMRLLEQALERDPSLANAHHQLALELLKDLSRRKAGVACADAREACLRRAAEHARQGVLAGSARTGILEARLLVEQGDPRAAEERLASTCEQLPGDLECIDALVSQALANGSPRLPNAVRSLVATGCSSPERCATTHLNVGNRFANAGQWNLALSHYQHACDEAPSPTTWQALAQAADRLGQSAIASSARQHLGFVKEEPVLPPRPASPPGSASLHPPPPEPTPQEAPGNE